MVELYHNFGIVCIEVVSGNLFYYDGSKGFVEGASDGILVKLAVGHGVLLNFYHEIVYRAETVVYFLFFRGLCSRVGSIDVGR